MGALAVLLLLVSLLVYRADREEAGPQEAGPEEAVLEEAARTITEADFARRVGVIAHDSMQGRDTPSEGLDKTAAWIASEFRRMGLRGGAEDGGFLQVYPLRRGSLDREASSLTAPNVVGILDGSDPVLKDEYVVFSGHMDHMGMGTPDQNGDSIFNGADDDASGTIAVVEIAEAMTALPTPPKRSMIFLLVSGEEKGLWGSEYYAENPSVPLDRLVADLNIDMVSRNSPDTIVAIGKEHSDLGETLDRVNRLHPELGMTAIDDPWPEENLYTRSDHYMFARRGVPVLFFFNGIHEDYHGRDDEVDRIDAEKAARVARLVFYLGVHIANAPERPTWNPESYARIVVSDRSR